MNIPFFREQSATVGDVDVMPLRLLEDTAEVVTVWQDSMTANARPTTTDPARHAPYVRIGLVSVENEPEIPELLRDAPQAAPLQQIRLPRNPRIAGGELYELDGMDYIVMLSGRERGLSKDLVRWLKRLKPLGIPMLVLLPNPIEGRRDRQLIDLLSQRVGVPVMAMSTGNIEQARRDFVLTIMDVLPAMSLALAANFPSFRDPLTSTLLDNAISDSYADDRVQDVQMQMVRQMCAAHGLNEREFEKQRIAMETLVKSTAKVAENLAGLFPIRDRDRRQRFNNALSTMLIGHATAMHLGVKPPSIYKQLIPQIWRLYRASRHPISAE